MVQPRLNFRGVSVLLVDRSHYCRSLVAQMLRAFGVQSVISCETGAEAKDQLKTNSVELCVIEADLPDMTGADLINWIRRENKEPLRFVPILVLSGYTQMRLLSTTRDAGANLLLKKPLSAQAMFDRLAWLARTPRSYIETKNYVGPDRRFKEVAPPDDVFKRETDAPAQAAGTDADTNTGRSAAE
jgi:CheY-like chemotaxis protein